MSGLATAERRGYMPRAAKSDWHTPAEIIELLHLLWDGKPDLDPCASTDPAHHFSRENFCPPMDGLEQRWKGRVFVNPPFDALDEWTEACELAHRQDGAEVVLLLPARTDTRYWQAFISRASAICFWKGRLRFVGAAACAPFPVAFVYWGPRPWDFHAVFRGHGMVVAP